MAKIFLVDDDVDLIRQNKMVLSEAGHDVATAHTAQEAQERIDQINPDLMVVDVMMEHRSAGLKLAREIGKKHPDMPLIILSGDENKTEWMQEPDTTWDPIVKFLSKPLTPNKLAEIVNEVLSNGDK